MTLRLPAGAGFDHVEDWVFDLDNTLYPAECDLFAEIDTGCRSNTMPNMARRSPG